MSKEVRVVGVDNSLNHGAFILLVNGKLHDLTYYTDNKGAAERSERGHRLLLKKMKPPDHQLMAMERLVWLEDLYQKTIKRMKPDFVSLEDYALDSKRGGHFTGEIGGILRTMCFKAGQALRLHDPLSLKMFTAHNGHAEKHQMEAAVKERWGKDFSKYNGPAQKNKQPNRVTSEDLCDAYALAQLGWLEVQIRRGMVPLKSLHEKEIQVFQRVTKTYSVSLLGREWIKKNE